MDVLADYNAGFLIERKYRDHFTAVKERPMICVSFFGLDQPSLLPPNLVVTGPLLRSDE